MCGEGCATDRWNMDLLGVTRFQGSLKGNNVNSRGLEMHRGGWNPRKGAITNPTLKGSLKGNNVNSRGLEMHRGG